MDALDVLGDLRQLLLKLPQQVLGLLVGRGGVVVEVDHGVALVVVLDLLRLVYLLMLLLLLGLIRA